MCHYFKMNADTAAQDAINTAWNSYNEKKQPLSKEDLKYLVPIVVKALDIASHDTIRAAQHTFLTTSAIAAFDTESIVPSARMDKMSGKLTQYPCIAPDYVVKCHASLAVTATIAYDAEQANANTELRPESKADAVIRNTKLAALIYESHAAEDEHIRRVAEAAHRDREQHAIAAFHAGIAYKLEKERRSVRDEAFESCIAYLDETNIAYRDTTDIYAELAESTACAQRREAFSKAIASRKATDHAFRVATDIKASRRENLVKASDAAIIYEREAIERCENAARLVDIVLAALYAKRE